MSCKEQGNTEISQIAGAGLVNTMTTSFVTNTMKRYPGPYGHFACSTLVYTEESYVALGLIHTIQFDRFTSATSRLLVIISLLFRPVQSNRINDVLFYFVLWFGHLCTNILECVGVFECACLCACAYVGTRGHWLKESGIRSWYILRSAPWPQNRFLWALQTAALTSKWLGCAWFANGGVWAQVRFGWLRLSAAVICSRLYWW